MSLIGLYLNQTFTHQARSANDANGQTTYATGTDRRGRIEERLRQFTAPEGQKLQSLATVFHEVDPAALIAPGDRITYLGQTWQVLAVSREIWGNGTTAHARAYLGAG